MPADEDRPGTPAGEDTEPTTPDQPAATGEDGEKPKKRRRRRRRRKGSGEGEGETQAQPTDNGGEQQDLDEATGEKRGRRPKAPKPVVKADNPEVFNLEQTFDDLGLPEQVLRGVKEAGFDRPTRIQAGLIPAMLDGRDVLGQAKTGTGKTAAFGLPLLSLCEPGVKNQALVLAPTRELAIQIVDEINELGKHTKLRAMAVYGGQSIRVQAERLKKGAEIIVATPGRVMDMADRGHLSFSGVRFAVLDEVDRMLDIGFRDDIRKILRKCPSERQTVVVSATISGEIEELARRYMRKSEKVETGGGSLTVSLVKQYYLTVDPWDKKRLLHHLLTHEEPALTVVFCRLKKSVDSLAKYLTNKKIDAFPIHGDMSQSQRNRTMSRLREGDLAVLIASDLASRGLDVEGISHVINYDLPEDPDLYIHRIGRTARAGRGGVAWSLVTPAQGKLLTQIENLINAEIPKLDYPDFEHRPQPDDWTPEPTGGRPPVVIEGAIKQARNRYQPLPPPDRAKVVKLGDKVEDKFPGGVVPSKLPPKRIQGRVRTSRTNKLDL